MEACGNDFSPLGLSGSGDEQYSLDVAVSGHETTEGYASSWMGADMTRAER
jgi:hypothetical protein